MSKKSAKISEEARDEQKNDSVYDFLYYDRRRVGSFLAQFDNAGHLQRITQSRSAAEGATRGYKLGVGAGGSIAGTGAQGNINFERSPGEIASEATERIYDPLWTNAIVFLDYLEDHNLLVRAISDARIGQFTMLSGNLNVVDISLYREFIGSETVKNKLRDDWEKLPATLQLRTDLEKKLYFEQKSGERMAHEVSMAIVERLPNFLQATLEKDGTKVWCILSSDSLVGQASDLYLKHGSVIEGIWNIVGILDASIDKEPPLKQPVEQPNLSTAQLIESLAPWIRKNPGRPYGSFGMTPLLIFREVSG